MACKRILLVEDEPFMRMLIKKILSKTSHNLIGEAADGIQAVEMYKEITPDLVIIDITMPNMNGIDAARKIRAVDPGARMIMCSAMGADDKIQESVDAGAIGFIIKPFNEEGVLRAVENALKYQPGDCIQLTHYAGDSALRKSGPKQEENIHGTEKNFACR